MKHLLLTVLTALMLLPDSPVCAARPDCINCNSTGWIDCPVCRRKDKLWCSACAARERPCPKCKGLGHARCPGCLFKTVPDGPDVARGAASTAPWAAATSIGAELIVIENRTLRLATDLSHKRAHELFNDIKSAADYLSGKFRVDDDDCLWSGRCTVYVFETRATYAKFTLDVDDTAEMTHTGAYSRTENVNPLVAISHEKLDEDGIRRIALHELAHVFLDLYRSDVKMPAWLSEGFAQAFEFRHKTKGSRRRRCVKLVKTAFAMGAGPHIEEVLDRPLAPSDEVGYAVSWSLTSFLATHRGFWKFIDLMKDDVPQRKAIQRVFRMPLRKLDRRWRMYVKRAY